MSIHTIIRLGNLDVDFRALGTEDARPHTKAGHPSAPDVPSEKVDGIVFGYMQRGGSYFCVQVDDLVLRAPVLLIDSRHTDAKSFFSPPQFGDDSAMRLLVDCIIANPEYRDVLAGRIRTLGP